MMRVRNTLAILAITALFGCAVDSPASTPTTDQVNLTLNTTHATQPLIRELTQHYADVRPEFKLDIQEQSHSYWIDQLKLESIDYFISRYVPVEKDVWAAPLARDGLVLIVHPDNPVDNLSVDTVREIFGGNQTQWQHNGQDILVLTLQTTDDVYHEFHHLIMGRQRITSNAQVVPNIDAMIRAVAENPDAIGYVPLSQVTDEVKVLSIDGVLPDISSVRDNIYPLRTTIFIIGWEEPPPIYRTFVSWIQSREGQSIIARDYVELP